MRRLLLPVLLVVATLVGLPTTAPVSAAPVAGPDDFYTPPTPLPAGGPGLLIRSEPMVVPATLLATARRVMYRSEDARGGPIAVTGTVIVPLTPWLNGGKRPVIGFAPAVLGLETAYPDLVRLDDYLNDRGERLADAIARECVWESLPKYALTQTRTLTEDGRPVADYLVEEPFVSLVAEQRIGERAPQGPIFVAHSSLDDIVPYGGEGSQRQARSRELRLVLSRQLSPVRVADHT